MPGEYNTSPVARADNRFVTPDNRGCDRFAPGGNRMATRVELDDTAEAINDYLYGRGMTDGLPVVAPTEARVAAMVAASGRPAEAVIGEVPPLNDPATVEQVAINAVMAGCEPRYVPALLAAVEALL